MASIAISSLTKRFGPSPPAAVDGIDLTIDSGELFFLLGPSGCGKTTLLRMLAGFIDPTAGSIRFDDRDVTHLPPNQRNTGMVFQSYALWPHMSVAENVAYGLNVRKVPVAENRERVAAALRGVHMHEYAERKPNQLSGGQQQRVALARALVIQPTVLLLDEPLSNLDAKLRLEMRSEIRRICKDSGITAVYVTHDQKEALSMADRMAVLRAGKIVQIGQPREMYVRPRTRFVAEFLGETNFLPATVRGVEGESVVLDSPAGVLRSRAVADVPANGLSVGRRVTVSIRPEAWHLRGASSSGDVSSARCRGRLVSTMYLGEVVQRTIALTDDLQVRVLELNPATQRIASDREITADVTTVTLSVNADDVVILED